MKSIPPIPTHRQCRKCNQTKPLDDFCFDRKGRYQRSWECLECKKIRRLEYNTANRDKIREADANRSPESRAKKAANERAKYQVDGELKRIQSRHYMRNHTDRHHSTMKEWRKNNPTKLKVHKHARRTRVAGNGGYFTDKDIANMQHIQQGHCCYCGRMGQRFHLDHIIPIKQGGPSDPWNLALACQKCNTSKGGKTLDQWTDRWYSKRGDNK